MEVLSQYVHINQNKKIKGLSIHRENNQNVKVVQYADDTTLFLKNTRDLKNALESLELFGHIAGIELNLTKCEGLWIGSYKHRQLSCNICNIRWPQKPIRYLGIYIGHNTSDCFKLNFEDKITSIDRVLSEAEKRNLTLFGKVCIIKSVAISKLMYIAMCLTIPEKIIKDIDQRIFKFLWGKRDRIKRKSVINKLEEGGLSMIDLKTQICAIKAAWTNRIITAPYDHLWSYLPKLYLSKFGNNYFIVKSTVVSTKMFPSLKTIPEFYQDIILSYNKSKILNNENFHENIMNQPIWCNKYIKFKGKTLLFKTWIEDGIVMLKNLRLNNGTLDVEFLANIIHDKRQFYREINILQKALTEAGINISIEPCGDIRVPVFLHKTDELYEWSIKKSKYYYKHLIEDIVEPPTSQRYWSNYTGLNLTQDLFNESCKQKIKALKDKKLAETNFKILNNILPCNRNLLKWGKSETNLCCFCQEEETISHLLFYCTYAKSIWEVVNNALLHGENVTHDMVLFGYDTDKVFNHLFSIIVYYIYREWLICSLEKRHRKQQLCYNSFLNYLNIRKNVYFKCSNSIWVDVCIKLICLITYLEDNHVGRH